MLQGTAALTAELCPKAGGTRLGGPGASRRLQGLQGLPRGPAAQEEGPSLLPRPLPCRLKAGRGRPSSLA